jgi:colanic acid/amylovoran biosynthesis protein
MSQRTDYTLKKALILDEFNSFNNGEMARVISLAYSLRALRPAVEMSILSSSPPLDQPRYSRFKIQVIARPWYKKTPAKIGTFVFFIGVSTSKLFGYTLLRALGKRGKLHEYDLFVHLTGDVFNDKGLSVLYYHLYHVLFGLAAGKKTVIYAESMGPFRSKLTSYLSRLIFNKVDLITVREKISLKYLDQIGVNKARVVLTGDPAFLLKPTAVPLEDVRAPVVGVSVNPDMLRYFSRRFGESNGSKRENYAKLMAHSIDYLIEHYGVSVLLFAHVIRPDSDDIRMSEDVYNRVLHKDHVRLVRNYYTADEIKGAISTCDLFLGSRMHATIASISTGVPTVVLGHTHKFQGVLGRLLDDQSLVSIRGYDYSELQSELSLALDYTWANRVAIRKRLGEQLPFMQDLAMVNAKYVVSMFDSQ